jgi:uncharacterized protein (UPF0147 family)
MDLKTLQDIPPWEWPRGIGNKFLTILRDRQADAADRLLAADFAGELVAMSDPLADALLFIVGSAAEPEELRAKAAISLGPVLEQADIDEFDDPESVPISEKTFRKIKQALRKVYLDSGLPKLVRRRILEAAVRAQEEWQTNAIRTAYASDDQEWKLTAVFCMNYVRGFDQQILESLESADPEIHYEAVRAAGTWEVDAAWPHVSALAAAADTDKDLRLAAIEALSTIRASESIAILAELADDDDEEIAEAADEALSMAQGFLESGEDEDEDEDDELDDEEFDDDDDDDEGHETVH